MLCLLYVTKTARKISHYFTFSYDGLHFMTVTKTLPFSLKPENTENLKYQTLVYFGRPKLIYFVLLVRKCVVFF